MKEYRIAELAALSGLSTRTLRFYDQTGLLKPLRTETNGYRVYGEAQLDRLQQILLYRELGMRLEDIAALLDSPDFDPQAALTGHLKALEKEAERLNTLINTVRGTLAAMKGEQNMSDSKKFEGFKAEMLRENEEKYGKEVRERYGAEKAELYNGRIKGMSEEQWKTQTETENKMLELLKAAMKKNDPACPEALEAADLHRQWLCFFWTEAGYTAEAHRGVAAGYTEDKRFTAYYEERLGSGGAEFLRKAVEEYTKNK